MSRKIYHRNDARPALIGMGLSAKRLLFMCLAQLERSSTKDNVVIKFDASKDFIIKVREYADLCEIDYSAAYRQMVEGVKELRGYVLESDQGLLKKKDDSAPPDWIEPFTIADKGTGYSKGGGFVKIKFAEEMEPLISNLTGNFTGQFLLSAMQLPDGNAGKLYLMLREWISSGYLHEKIIEVEELKYSLGVSEFKTYDLFNDFKNLFFKRSVKKLIERTEFTEITMDISERRARKAYKLKIKYRYDASLVSKKEKIIEKVFSNKSDILNVDDSQDSIEESLFFIDANRYLTRKEAEINNLNWEDGITAKELLEKLKK